MRTALLIAMAVVLGGPSGQQPPLEGAVPFDSGWTLAGERTRIVRQAGLDVLELESGFAHRREIRLLDGVIDFDVRLTQRRSFVYVYFRVQSDGEREEFYLRPHKSNLPDAVQYAPVWQNRSAWQLHHGPGGTAAVPFDANRWTHVRVVIQGRAAALFVDDMKTPALLVPRLSRDPQAGSVSLGGFLPADVPGEGPIATFANVQVRPGTGPFDLTAPLAAAAVASAIGVESDGDASVVTTWSVSGAFVPQPAKGLPAVPPVAVTGEFRRLVTEPAGLLQLHRDVKVPDGSRVSAAVARIRLTAAAPRVVAFDLGFSDTATVVLNGVPIFAGEASYSFDRPRREGLIGFDQARLYLPLRAGENDLSVIVTDSFGGWGLMGRLVKAPDVKVEAR
jgi:hypothetical protein